MLTNLLLGIILTAGLLYGLYVMRGIDNFLGRQERLHKEEARKGCAVVFGGRGACDEIGSVFEESGVRPVYLDTICIDKDWGKVGYLAAISESDIDNLSVCNLFCKMYPDVQMFGICNEKSNLKLFRKTHIRIFKDKDELLQRLELLAMENEVGAA